MEVLASRVSLRRAMHDFYVDLFQNIPGVFVYSVTNEDYYANYWLSCILIDSQLAHGIDREALRLAFEVENIESRPLCKPMHLQPIFAKYPYYGDNIAETLFEKGLCLPSGSNLTEEEKDRIRKVVFNLFSKQ
jgi:dTDP-4-amino-4,6-dideoxygalactose transaminase